jgi:carbonyl reductase 1
VINNAGISPEGPPGSKTTDSSIINQVVDINYTATLDATQSLLPQIRFGGRLVNVSSTAGVLSKYPEALQKRFTSANAVENVTDLMDEYCVAAKKGKAEELGWPERAYGVSKTGLTTVTRVIAEYEKEKGSNILINSCCPGLVKVCYFDCKQQMIC